MFRQQAIAGAARRLTLVALSIPAICLAAGGTLRFQGAVTESACAVSAAHAGFSQAMLQRLGAARGSASVDGGAMHLSMRCNANQSVGLSFESKASEPGAAGVDVVLSRVGKDLRPGDAIPVALVGKRDNGIDINTALRKAAGGGTLQGGRMDGAILVSVSYL